MNQFGVTNQKAATVCYTVFAIFINYSYLSTTTTVEAFTTARTSSTTAMLSRASLLSSSSSSSSKAIEKSRSFGSDATNPMILFGYLDTISRNELYDDRGDPNAESESRESTQMNKEQIDRYGPGDLSSYVDFGDEFDGGDGQMGVAGDGNKGLEKEWVGGAEMAKSKSMSAKNAWGKSTGYADQLVEQGVDQSKAQQLENWKNQREVQEQRNYQKYMTEEFDNKQGDDENWRMLSKFGGEQVQDVDLDQELGMVQLGQQLTGTIELTSRLNQASVHEFSIKNPFMGFSDYRARFTMMTNPMDWTVSPTDGSLNGRGSPQDFVVKFRPQSPSVSEGFLVIETEEDKWTYKLIGTASM